MDDPKADAHAHARLRAAPLTWKARFLGSLVAWLIRIYGLTLRFTLEDRAGVTSAPPEHPMIWAFWHNTIFTTPLAYRKYLKQRRGVVLTSASGDGAILAAFMESFGVAAARGSSSRRGATALLILVDWAKRGFDVVMTPDGPRGPRYRLAPGLVKLAQKTGTPVLPIRVEYSREKKLRTWDHFRVPWPFSSVRVVFEPLEWVERGLSPEEFEAARLRIETILKADATD